MQKSTLKPMGVRSLYPLDYDKNNPMPGYQAWRMYIHLEFIKTAITNRLPDGISVTHIGVRNPDMFKSAMAMESALAQAKSIAEGRAR